MKTSTLITVCVLAAAVALVGRASANNIVDNWDFSDSLSHWGTHSSGVGSHLIEVLPSYEGYDWVLHMRRRNSQSDGGRDRVYQDFTIDPYDCHSNQMKISMRLKIVSYNLRANMDWWPEVHGGFGAYPIHLYVFSGAQGNEDNPMYSFWNWGFWHDQNDADHLHNYHRVDGPMNHWYEGSGIVPVPGYHLTGLQVTAHGWDYEIYIDYIEVEPIAGPFFVDLGEFGFEFELQESALNQPSSLQLLPISPNPFNPMTSIAFDIPSACQVRAMLYSLQGKLVRTLLDQEQPAGRHVLHWNGRDDGGRKVASGIYFLKIEAGEEEAGRKIALSR